MKLFSDKRQCYGCTACCNICPKNAITMVKDGEGFYYPKIDEKKCIECGLCRLVCPINIKIENNEIKKVFAVKHKDKNIRLNSSSGGLLTLISDYVLLKDGIIYGASFDSDFCVNHCSADDEEKRNLMRGSKYVQSYLGNIFVKIKLNLDSSKVVLFIGTPCQVAGLKGYLKKDYKNLILCDLVCHGVSSPLVFQEYISLVKKRYGDINTFMFRDKEVGWRGSNISVITKSNRKYSNTNLLNIIKQIYYGHYATRPSCHNCEFTNINRISDITIGDFWGIEDCSPSFEDKLGVSLLLLNSNKGESCWNLIKDKTEYLEETISNCKQPQLYKPTKASQDRDSFWDNYYKYGFLYISKKYTNYGRINRIKCLIKKILCI